MQLCRRVALVVDGAVEHRPRHDIGQAVIRGLLGVRRPFLGIGPGDLATAAGGADLERRDAIEIVPISFASAAPAGIAVCAVMWAA